jgi:hypothetical protein
MVRLVHSCKFYVAKEFFLVIFIHFRTGSAFKHDLNMSWTCWTCSGTFSPSSIIWLNVNQSSVQHLQFLCRNLTELNFNSITSSKLFTAVLDLSDCYSSSGLPLRCLPHNPGIPWWVFSMIYPSAYPLSCVDLALPSPVVISVFSLFCIIW